MNIEQHARAAADELHSHLVAYGGGPMAVGFPNRPEFDAIISRHMQLAVAEATAALREQLAEAGKREADNRLSLECRLQSVQTVLREGRVRGPGYQNVSDEVWHGWQREQVVLQELLNGEQRYAQPAVAAVGDAELGIRLETQTGTNGQTFYSLALTNRAGGTMHLGFEPTEERARSWSMEAGVIMAEWDLRVEELEAEAAKLREHRDQLASHIHDLNQQMARSLRESDKLREQLAIAERDRDAMALRIQGWVSDSAVKQSLADITGIDAKHIDKLPPGTWGHWDGRTFVGFPGRLLAQSYAECEFDLHEQLTAATKRAEAAEQKAAALQAEVERLTDEWAVMARACGNWRLWPGQPTSDHDHDDWKVAARAIIERDAAVKRTDEAEQLVARFEAAIDECCQCRWAHDESAGKRVQYQECHLHQCQRSVLLENGDPSDVTLLEQLAALQQRYETLRAAVCESPDDRNNWPSLIRALRLMASGKAELEYVQQFATLALPRLEAAVAATQPE